MIVLIGRLGGVALLGALEAAILARSLRRPAHGVTPVLLSQS